MVVHDLSAAQRCMLVELLVSERAGESALRVDPRFGRDRVASGLCRLRMVDWVADGEIILTTHGRGVAEALAAVLLGRGPRSGAEGPPAERPS